MSNIIIDQEQSKKFNLDERFWIDLYHLENDEISCEYLYFIAYKLKELKKKGFINPWEDAKYANCADENIVEHKKV